MCTSERGTLFQLQYRRIISDKITEEWCFKITTNDLSLFGKEVKFKTPKYRNLNVIVAQVLSPILLFLYHGILHVIVQLSCNNSPEDITVKVLTEQCTSLRVKLSHCIIHFWTDDLPTLTLSIKTHTKPNFVNCGSFQMLSFELYQHNP